MPTPLNIAIVGAPGAVGREMLAILEQRRFPHKSLRLFASERSAGTTLPFAGRDIRVEALTPDALKGVDIALFSAGSSITRDIAPAAAKHHCVIVDNSSAFRMDPKVPLVVPEVNPQALRNSSLPAFAPWGRCPLPPHRQPQLLHHHPAHGPYAAAHGVRRRARGRIHLPGGIGRGRKGHG